MTRYEINTDNYIYTVKDNNQLNNYTLASNSYYSAEETINPARLGSTLISIL